jgi:hypothetical protein
MTLPERASLTWQGVDRVCLREDRTYRGQVYWDTRRWQKKLLKVARRRLQRPREAYTYNGCQQRCRPSLRPAFA